MENRTDLIEAAAAALGVGVNEVKAWFDKGLNLPENFDKAAQSFEEFKYAAERAEIQMYRSKHAKPTNYTKPRNRKKKPKNKRR